MTAGMRCAEVLPTMQSRLTRSTVSVDAEDDGWAVPVRQYVLLVVIIRLFVLNMREEK